MLNVFALFLNTMLLHASMLLHSILRSPESTNYFLNSFKFIPTLLLQIVQHIISVLLEQILNCIKN